jgi:hypothetical protein
VHEGRNTRVVSDQLLIPTVICLRAALDRRGIHRKCVPRHGDVLRSDDAIVPVVGCRSARRRAVLAAVVVSGTASAVNGEQQCRTGQVTGRVAQREARRASDARHGAEQLTRRQVKDGHADKRGLYHPCIVSRGLLRRFTVVIAVANRSRRYRDRVSRYRSRGGLEDRTLLVVGLVVRFLKGAERRITRGVLAYIAGVTIGVRVDRYAAEIVCQMIASYQELTFIPRKNRAVGLAAWHRDRAGHRDRP